MKEQDILPDFFSESHLIDLVSLKKKRDQIIYLEKPLIGKYLVLFLRGSNFGGKINSVKEFKVYGEITNEKRRIVSGSGLGKYKLSGIKVLHGE